MTVSLTRAIAATLTVALLFSLLPARVSADEAPLSFSKDIAPILIKNCQACHGPPEPKGGYQVINYTHVVKPGESESASVTPGKPAESELFNLVASDDADLRMPKEADALSPAQIELIKRWIAEGAKYDAADANAPLASIVPKGVQPDPPAAYRRPVPITAVAFNHDASELAVGGYHEVTIWKTADGALLRRIKNVPQRVHSLNYSPDGTLLAMAGGTPGQSGEVKLFNPADGALVKEVCSTADVAYRAVFNPAGNKLAVGGADRAIRIFDVASGKEEILIEDHADWVVGLAWSPDGTKLVSASRDKTSKMFNAANGESLTTYSGHGDAVFDAGFSGDGKLVLSAGNDKKVHAWNPDDGAKKGEIAGYGREVLGLVAYADKVFTCSADKTVRQHKLEGFAQLKLHEGLTDVAYAVAIHPASGKVAAGSFAGEVRIWNAEDGAAVAAFIAAPGYTPPAPVAAK
ncbi:MAG: c-type cytochrome domain-containing protein [Pirellulales bacterium]